MGRITSSFPTETSMELSMKYELPQIFDNQIEDPVKFQFYIERRRKQKAVNLCALNGTTLSAMLRNVIDQLIEQLEELPPPR